MKNDNTVVATVRHEGFEPANLIAKMDSDGAIYVSLTGRFNNIIGYAARKPNPKTYHIGQKFRLATRSVDNDIYLLAQMSLDEAVLICTNDGLRWSHGTKVKDIDNITEDEFKRISDFSDFEEVTG